MLTFALSLLIFQPPASVQDPAAELKKLTPAILSSLEKYCLEAHKLNGTVSSYLVDGANKKLTHKTVVKSDKSRYMIVEYNGDQRFVSAEVCREAGDTRQALVLVYSVASKTPRLQQEYYVKKGDKFISDEYDNMNDNARMYAYYSPTTFALRPMPQMNLSFADLIENPAFVVTSLENTQGEGGKIVKISFKIDQEINAKQSSDNQIHALRQGWFELRPDQYWTMNRAEYTLVGARKEVTKWKVDFLYDREKNVIPLLKEIKMTGVDQKENAASKPINEAKEFDFKVVEEVLPDEQFSLSQINSPERTVEAGLKHLEDRTRREALANLNPPPPPGGFPVAKQAFEVPPWVWLAGGLVAFLVVMQIVFRVTSKKIVS